MCSSAVVSYYAISAAALVSTVLSLESLPLHFLSSGGIMRFNVQLKQASLHFVGFQRLHLVACGRPSSISLSCLPLPLFRLQYHTNDRLGPTISCSQWFFERPFISIQVYSSTAGKHLVADKSISPSTGPPDPCSDSWLRGQWAHQMISVKIWHRTILFKTKWMSRSQAATFLHSSPYIHRCRISQMIPIGRQQVKFSQIQTVVIIEQWTF